MSIQSGSYPGSSVSVIQGSGKINSPLTCISKANNSISVSDKVVAEIKGFPISLLNGNLWCLIGLLTNSTPSESNPQKLPDSQVLLSV